MLEISDVSPRLLRCYVALAEELHFGAAADRLYVAQSALSRSIQRLEAMLERPLFTRTTRSVELTPAGATLLEPARAVLRSLDVLAGELSARVLRVGHVPGSDTTALILDRLDPEIDVVETTLDGASQLAALRAGELDVAVCHAPDGEEFRSQLVRLDPLLIGVFGRAAGERRPVDVTRRAVAAPTGSPQYETFLRGYEDEAGCRLDRVRVAVGSGVEAYGLRRAGARAFVTLSSVGVRVDCTAPTAPALPVQAYYPWSAIWRRDTHSPAVRAFVRAAEELSRARRWLDTSALPGRPWVPA